VKGLGRAVSNGLEDNDGPFKGSTYRAAGALANDVHGWFEISLEDVDGPGMESLTPEDAPGGMTSEEGGGSDEGDAALGTGRVVWKRPGVFKSFARL